MSKYSDMPFLANMIDALSVEISGLEKDMADGTEHLKAKYRHTIKILKRSQAAYRRRYNALADELSIIKADDPDVYSMIYWHDLKRKTWTEVFNITCDGLMSMYPECYCKRIVDRYLMRNGYTQ